LSGWTLSDNDGNTFNLTGAGFIPVGGYLVCHLGQTGTNSSTDVYGPPSNMLDDTDDLELINSRGAIIDYVAWGGDPGSDDDDAVTAGEWTDGEYVDTSLIVENETIGRDRDSNDTNSPSDWENATNEADPFGVNATHATPGAQNIDCIIPEFDILAIPIMLISVIILYFNRFYKLCSKSKSNSIAKKHFKMKRKLKNRNKR
jgi:hypothetical protein